MNVTIRQLEAFLCVANLGSFTRAAEQLHITQPGLSLMIQELEGQLGSRLFERTTRSVRVTGAGQRFAAAAQRMVDEFHAAASQLKELSTEHRQTLWVGATPLFSSCVMPAVYQRFRRSHPAVDLRVVDVPREEVERMVRSGEVDCGLGIFPKRTPEVERKPLFEFDFMLVEAADERRALFQNKRQKFARIRWKDLPDVPFVGLPSSIDLQQLINKHKAAAGLRPDSRGVSQNYLETLIGMAAAGAGPTIVPSFALPACTRFRVKASLITDPVLSLDFHLITKRSRAQPKVLGLFTEVLQSVIAEGGDRVH
jgi:DNA-binding transcriptional LysR family regulator